MKKILLLASLFISCIEIANAQPGALDYSFGKKGVVRSDLGSNVTFSGLTKRLLLQGDGSMYVVFESEGIAFVTKKRPNGSPDSAYGHNGYSAPIPMRIAHAALQKDGKIVVAGTVDAGYNDVYGFYSNNSDFALARYNSDGSLDHRFGQVTTDFNYGADAVNSIAIQSDGKIVVAGRTAIHSTDYNYDDDNYPHIADNIALARYNINGSLDNTFDGDGKLITELQTDVYNDNSIISEDDDILVAIQIDGKIVVAGSGNN